MRRIALVSLAALLTAAPALAAEVMTPQGWQTGVMRKPDGSFAYCVSESKFENSLWLVLALNPTGDVNLGVGQQGAALPVGQTKPVVVKIDDNAPLQLTAKAVKPELMVINAGQSNSLLDAMAKGQRLDVDHMSFSLAGSGDVIATLRECVQASASQNVAAAPAPAAVPQPEQAAAVPAPAPTVEKPAIVWNQPVALPGDRDSNLNLPPSMQNTAVAAQPSPQQQAQAALSDQPTVAFDEAAAPEPAVSAAAPAMAPELVPPKPDANIVGYPAGALAPSAPPPAAAPLAETPAPVPAAAAPVAEASLPVPAPLDAPVTKPLPAQLEHLLQVARVRDLQPAPVTESDVAFAWKSRDMLGNVREIPVPAGSNIVQLAGQHFSQLKSRCTVQFSASLGAPQDIGALELLTGSTVCRGNGSSVYTTLVFALSKQGVLSIVSHQIDQGRRAAPDRAQAGVVEALKDIQG